MSNIFVASLLGNLERLQYLIESEKVDINGQDRVKMKYL